MADKIGFAPVLCVNAALQAVCLFTFNTHAAVSSKGAFMFWCCWSSFFFGGNFATFPT
eukprot:gene7372-5716_t